MFRFLVLTFLVASAYGGTSSYNMNIRHIGDITEDRVVGGQSADIRDAPYQVAMLRGSGGTFRLSCGGIIISPNVVLSAAHCPSGTAPNTWRARVGSTQSSSGGQLLEVQSITSHPQYTSRFDYDVCLYKLSSAINIDGVTTRAIPLPAQDQAVADGAPAFITGWGSTRSGGAAVEDLRKLTTTVVNQQLCANSYGGTTITPRMICAGNFESGGEDACQGDSGGPLAVNGVIIGITSFGNGCALPRYPGVWTRVPSFRNWIDNNM